MRVDCYKCGTAYRIPDEAIGAGGVRAECPRCGFQETIRTDRTGVGPAPKPPPMPGQGGAPGRSPGAAAPAAPAPAPAAPGAGEAAALFDYSGVPGAGPAAPSAAVVAHGDDDDPFADIDTSVPVGPGAAPAAVPAPRPPPAAASQPAPAPQPAARPQPATPLPRPATPLPRPDPGTGFVHGAPTPTPAGIHVPPARTEPEYRVKKPDGRVLGPVGYAALEQMAETGELAPGDQVARDDDEFRLISQYEEAAHLLEKAASHYRVRTAAASMQGPRRARWPWVVGTVVVLLVGGAAAVGRFAPHAIPAGLRKPLAPVLSLLAPSGPALPPNPVKAQLARYRLQIPEAKGTAAAQVKQARALMAKDTVDGYRGADVALKKALILDPDDADAIGLFVLNTAYLDGWHSGPKTLQVLLAYADYLGQAHPKAPTVHLARATANLLIGKGQATEARDEAQKAVDADPHSVSARIVLARATNLFDHQAARKMIDDLQKDAGADPRVILTRGFICQADGDFACAEKAFRARLDKTPGQEEASNALARLYVLLGRYDDAGAVYRAILKADPDRVDAELDLAVLDYQVRGDLRGAARRLATLRRHGLDLADAVTAARIRTHSAVVARLQGHLDDADKLVRQVLKDRPLDGPGSYQGALLAILQHDPSRARDLAASVSASLDDPARVAVLHALVAHVAADDDGAEAAARQAATADPGALAPVLLATALEGDLGKPRQAYLLMQKVIAIDPADARRSRPPTDYYDGAVAAQVTVKGFEALVKADPQQGLAYAGLGIARYLAGDVAGARTALQKAVSLDDQNVPALVYLGELARARGDLAEAKDDFSQAVDSDHLAPLPQYLLGRVQELQGRLRPAAVAYRRTLRLDPGFHLATVRLALMRARRGDKDGARHALLQVLTLHPDSVEARRALYAVE